MDHVWPHWHIRIGQYEVRLCPDAVRGGHRLGRSADTVLLEDGGCELVGPWDCIQYVFYPLVAYFCVVERNIAMRRCTGILDRQDPEVLSTRNATDTSLVLSALSSRYIPLVLFPYFIALAAQLLASAYATAAVSETLDKGKFDRSSTDNDDSEDEEESQEEDEGEHGWAETIEHMVDPLVEPIKPLRLLMPRKEGGVWHWRLSVVTLSMLSTSCGVSPLLVIVSRVAGAIHSC